MFFYLRYYPLTLDKYIGSASSTCNNYDTLGATLNSGPVYCIPTHQTSALSNHGHVMGAGPGSTYFVGTGYQILISIPGSLALYAPGSATLLAGM